MHVKHRNDPYMPDDDPGKRTWMERFLRVIETDPPHFGFHDPVMFEYFQRTLRTFVDAVREVSNKGTRSTCAVVSKNQARKKAVDLCREHAMRLKFDPTLTDAEKSTLGLNVVTAAPEAAKLPPGALPGVVGRPELAVTNSPNGGHVIKYKDGVSGSKAKPKGVSHLLLYGAIGEKPKMPVKFARLMGAYTKRPFEVMYPEGCGLEGLYVTYYARWLTTRGEISPWSRGVSVIIGGTTVSLMKCPFRHLFTSEGFVDALPEGLAAQPPMLEGAVEEPFGAYEFIEPRQLTWQAFALLEAAIPAR